MKSDPPSLDNRTFEDILRQIEELARSYLYNRWIYATSINAIRNSSLDNNSFANKHSNHGVVDRHLDILQNDVGIALSKIFASFYMNILSRLNKLPKKNFIEFLNVMGFNLSSPTASRVPVTFKLADGAKEDVFVPSGTVVASDANEKHDELIFETEENMRVTRANILHFYAVNKKIDAIYSHVENLKNSKDFKLFPDEDANIQEHILYVGHQDLFNLKNSPAKILLTIKTQGDDNVEDLLFHTNNVVWEYNWKYDDKGKEIGGSASQFRVVVKDESNNGSREGRIIVLYHKENAPIEIEKLKVNGIENYWIRCRFKSSDELNLTEIDKKTIPTIARITANVELDPEIRSDETGSVSTSTDIPSRKEVSNGGFVYPDLLFYKDTPILVPTEDKDIKTSQNERFIYPFGRLPFTFDIFYIASNDCFSKKNTIITLKFFEINPNFKGSENEKEGELNVEPIISWEYWNGKGWNGLFIFAHKPEGKHEELSFICPADIDIFSINGNENYWIRARLVSGDYGKGKLIQKTDGKLTTRDLTKDNTNEKTTEWNPGTFDWDYSDIRAPKFKQVKIKFTDFDSFKAKYKQSTRLTDSQTPEMTSRPMCMIYNNLEYKEIPNSNNESSKPTNTTRVFKHFIDHDKNNFQNRESDLSSPSSSFNYYIYLGVDKKIESGPILIYVSVIEGGNYDDDVDEQFNFYYYSLSGWKKLYVEDGTNCFTRSGYIKLFLPSDFQSYSLFGDTLYWIKIEDPGNFYELEPLRIPKVHAFILNTVSCINASAIEDELLAKDERTSNEYKFVFSKKPLTLFENKREQIWVKEKVIISDKEWDALSEDNRIRAVKDSIGNLLETWVLWKEFRYQNYIANRSSYLSSSRDSTRIYSVDRIEGKLNLGSDYPSFFGSAESSFNPEGIRPSIEQIGVESLVKANYVFGGGSRGNVNEKEVKTLKTLIPFIDSVTNFDKGNGGSDSQNIQNAIETMPSSIKNRGQAVTIEDFESLIISNFVSLSRVACFPTTDNRGTFRPGHVLVVVIPKKESTNYNIDKDDKVSISSDNGTYPKEEMPYPSIALLRNIKQYLSKTASDTVVSLGKLHIRGPSYFRIFISANLYVTTINDFPITERKALGLIKKFFDPLEGGKYGKGWEFRKILSISDVYSLLSGISEVKHIDNVFARIELDKQNVINFEKSNNDKLRTEFILSETGKDIEAIISMLSPHSLLCDGKAHNLTMRIDT